MLGKWCEATSCDGFKEWYDSRRDPKSFVFWTIVMILSMSATIWFTYRTIVGYIESPTVTNIETVTQPSLDLPEILICYKGGLNVSSFREYNFTEQFIHGFQSTLFFGKMNRKAFAGLSFELQNFLSIHNLTLFKLATMLGYNCNDIIQSIIATDVNIVTCDQAQLWYLDAGNCFAFKTKLHQWYPDIIGGYQIQLKEPNNSYTQIFPTESEKLDLSQAFEIKLEYSLGTQESRRHVLIPVGSKIEITLNPKRYIRLNEDNRCSNNYCTSNACYFDCYTSHIERTNNCTPLRTVASVIGGRIADVCDPFAIPLANRKAVQNCAKGCKPLCDEWLFDPTLNYIPLPPLLKNVGKSIVWVGYNSMQYIKIEEVKAFTIDMAIANVGGQSGLWLGLSAVTVIQALYYLGLAICNKCNETKLSKLIKRQK